MKKIMALMAIGMFMLVGLGTAAMGSPDDPVLPNRPPNAPVVMEDKSGMEREEYRCFFYAVDPDGDQVYYHLSWEKIGDASVGVCAPDTPNVPWRGPFDSEEEVNEMHECCESGDYELTIRVKDEFDNEGPSTTVTVSYTKARVMQYPFLAKLLAKYPGFVCLLTKILKF